MKGEHGNAAPALLSLIDEIREESKYFQHFFYAPGFC